MRGARQKLSPARLKIADPLATMMRLQINGEFTLMYNMGNMMKQAQMLQENMQKVQAQIAAMEVTGESGGGLVKVTVTGKHEVRRVEISPEVFGDDREMCEDLIAAAFNDAARRVEEKSREMMQSITGGLKLPPGMKLPF